MNARILLATAARVLRQLTRDHRTVAMIAAVPSLLLTLIYYMYRDSGPLFERIAVVMLGVLPFIVMFLITSIAMQRERSSGTLERLMASPANKADLLFGYALAFAAASAIQATVTISVSYWAFDVRPAAGPLMVFLVAMVNAQLGVALGLLCSAFARTEFQAVQFMPVVVLPQILLCGLFVPRDQMAVGLQWLSDVFPLTYGVEALLGIATPGSQWTQTWGNAGIVVGAAVVALLLAAATLRRRSA